MKILVTGATGFIGRHLIRALLGQGNKISVLIRNEEIAPEIEKEGVKTVLGTLRNRPVLKKALKGIEVVFHLAAIRSDWGRSWEDYYETNVLGTKNLLEMAVGQVKHFILISSVKAGHPTTLYGKSKLLAEKEALEIFKNKGLPITIIRPAIVYGPGDHLSGMMPKLIRLIKSGYFLIVGSGENRLHLVYIDDLIQALLLVAQKQGKGKIYTIASKKPIRLKEMVSLIAEELKVKLLPIKVPILLAKTVGMILERVSKNEPIITGSKVETISSDVVFDLSKAQKELGFFPEVDYQEGIRKTIKWK